MTTDAKITSECRSASARFVDEKMLNDPSYAPYCMRCPGAVRMRRVAPREANCSCGAKHVIPADASGS